MKTTPNAKDIKDQASVLRLLAALGFQPQRKSGREHMFLSPLRDSDTKPSFSVNEQLGCWYDHGEGKGGNIIDFGVLYWKNLSFQEVLQKIVDLTDTAYQQPSDTRVARRTRLPVKEPNYRVLEVRELGYNKAITGYLENRSIFQQAQGLLKEVYYYVEDSQKHRMNFFAAGWQNELAAWEVRSANFKGCLGHKAISFIPGDEKKLAVFEGFINYLSWLAENPLANNSVLVLNSLSLLQSGIVKAKPFELIATYFDNDASGRNATSIFRQALPRSQDCSYIYEGYNDYNDKLISGNNSLGIQR